MTVVLFRDAFGREICWKCSDCGEPFTLGWGSRCNKCIREDEQFRKLLEAINANGHKYLRDAAE